MDRVRAKKLFIVDDHPLIRRGMRQLFESESSLKVCGEASTINDSIRAIKRSAPDLVVIDISLPDGSGIDLIKHLLASMPSLLILVSSMHDERLLAERSLRAGAKGYVSKQEAPEHLVEAVKTILDGNLYLSQRMTERLRPNSQTGKISALATPDSPIETLSNRELEVFEQIGLGHSTALIARHLKLSVKTIETYRANIKNKLNLSTSSELTRHAVHWSLEGTILN
jgi:DNA-binding NarL/FixJ family response regulator